MDIINAILTRSSYRGKYMDTIVPRNDLKKIMEVGLAAPSGCNKQTTSLIAIDEVNVIIFKIIQPRLKICYLHVLS